MYLCKMIVTAGIYIFKSNKGETRTTCKKSFSKFTKKTPERRHIEDGDFAKIYCG